MLGRTGETDGERRDRHRTALLRFVRVVDAHLHDAGRMLAAAVDDARHLGATWEDIGHALGVSAEAARERFEDVA